MLTSIVIKIQSQDFFKNITFLSYLHYMAEVCFYFAFRNM